MSQDTVMNVSKLTECPDCGNNISRRATSCPNCGAPANVLSATTDEPGIKTIQSTSKELKSHLIISVVIFWLGVLLLFNDSTRIFGVFITIISLLYFFFTKISIWWSHG